MIGRSHGEMERQFVLEVLFKPLASEEGQKPATERLKRAHGSSLGGLHDPPNRGRDAGPRFGLARELTPPGSRRRIELRATIVV